MRIAIAFLLSAAVVGVPLALDHCTETCEAARAAAATPADPVCHRAAPASASLVPVPGPCGHDHAGVTTLEPARRESTVRAIAATMVAPMGTAAGHLSCVDRLTIAAPAPPPDSIPLPTLSSLRI